MFFEDLPQAGEAALTCEIHSLEQPIFSQFCHLIGTVLQSLGGGVPCLWVPLVECVPSFRIGSLVSPVKLVDLFCTMHAGLVIAVWYVVLHAHFLIISRISFIASIYVINHEKGPSGL